MAEAFTEYGLEQLLDRFVTRANRLKLIGQPNTGGTWESALEPVSFTISSNSLGVGGISLIGNIEFDVVLPAGVTSITLLGVDLVNSTDDKIYVGALLPANIVYSGNGLFTLTDFTVDFQ